MEFYEFITPSDSITFKAPDDKVAFACAVLLGNGKAGCKNLKTGESLGSMLFLSRDPDAEMTKFLGMPMGEYLKQNTVAVKESFLTFSYGSVEERRTFDDACQAITDPKKLKKFKADHENRNRTSMSEWVKHAWHLGEKIK